MSTDANPRPDLTADEWAAELERLDAEIARAIDLLQSMYARVQRLRVLLRSGGAVQ